MLKTLMSTCLGLIMIQLQDLYEGTAAMVMGSLSVKRFKRTVEMSELVLYGTQLLDNVCTVSDS